MKNINFNVSQDIIEKLSDDVIISDSFNYVQLTFNFDSTWSQYNVKKATFFSDYENGEQQYEADIVNNVCVVPYEILQKSKFKSDFMVGVYGQAIQDSTLQQRNTTNMVVFSLRQGAYFVNALNPGKIDPSAYDLYLAQLQQIFQNGLNEYNSNAQTQINNFNSNANEKIQQLNGISANVEQIEQNIEKIQENVQQSEANTQTSAENAKTSEQNAQKSAENASKILTNVTGIQTNINETKGQIDTIKEGVDAKAGQVNTAVEEAKNQANISKQQAELSIKNANQTSANKIDIENMKNDVASIKTSVEQTKSDIEQIKTDTQTIYDDTLKAKEETLKAKTEVENSVGNERISNDKKYAKAIDTDEIEISEYGEVEFDEDGYMKDVEISTSKDITQNTRAGYNKLNLEKYAYSEAQSILNGSTVTLNNGILSIDASSATADVTVKSKSLAGANRDVLAPGKYYFGVNTNGYYESNPEKLVQLTQGIVDVAENYFLSQWYTTCKITEKIDKKLLLSDDVSKTEYEKYGASPTLEFSSEFKNIESSIKINNHQSNCLNNQMKSQTSNGVKLELNEDGSVHISGTATARTEPHVWDKASINDELVLKKGKEYFNYTGRALYFNVRKNTYLTIPNNKSYIPDEDLSIEHYVYIRIEKDETVDETIYPFLTTQKDSKYEEFKGNLKKVELGNQFLGSLNNYKNYIVKNRFKRNLNIYNITGNEKWQAHINSDYLKTPDESLDFFIQAPLEMKTGSIMLSNKFKFNNFDSGYRSNSNVESISNGGGYRRIYIRIKKDRLDSSDANGLKKFLKELYEKGDPVKILYITNTEYDEELFAEILDKLNSLKVYNGINQIDMGNFKLKFKSNRNLENYIDDQIKLNSTEEIKNYDSRYMKALKIKVEDVEQLKIFSEEKSVDELKIKGYEITQNERNGYNLLNNKLNSKTVKGVTFDVQEDGSIILNGTPAETIVVNLLTGNEGVSDVADDNQILEIPESIDKMVLSGCPANKQSKAFKIDLWSKSGELIGNDSDFGSGIKIDFSSNKNWRKINRARIVIYAFAKLDNTVFRPMLTEGTEQKPYEKYGATPSLKFPAEIEPKYPNIKIYNEEESVHIDVNVEAYGIKKFKDEIVRNKLIKYIKKLELTGAEEILKSSRDNLFYMQLDNIVCTSNVNIKSGLVLSNCFKNESYTDLRNYAKDYGIEVYLNRIYFRILDFNTAEEVKNKLKELYDSNNAVKIYYILSDPETFELTEEQKQQLDKFKLFDGANNILIENGKLSFKYNKSIQKVLEEKDDKINDLQNQIDEIKALLNTTNTSALLLSNLENDLESEVK